MRSLISHIVKGDEKNIIIFTFDVTKQSSYENFLKSALRSFIFETEELSDTIKAKKQIPFMILGLKNDKITKVKVS